MCLALNKIMDLQPDMCINSLDKKCHTHKYKLHNKSQLITKVINEKQTKIGDWPPINDIDIILPNNICFDIFETCMRIMEGIKQSVTIYNFGQILICMEYLEVNDDIVYDLLIKYLPNNILSPIEASEIYKILDFKCLEKYKYYIVSYYYHDFVSNGLDINKHIGNEKKYFFHKDNQSLLIPTTTDSVWIHMPEIDRKLLSVNRDIKFEAFGIKWILSRFIASSDYDDQGNDLIKLYVDGDDNNTGLPPFNLRATLIVYPKFGKPYKQIEHDNNIISEEYKLFYVKYKFGSHNIYFEIYGHKENNQRMSLFLQISDTPYETRL